MKSVCVLMSSYNGKNYIDEQLKSIFCQKNVETNIVVRDDGSSDGTTEILKDQSAGNFQWYSGRNVGPARSFLDLIYNSPDSDYYAFCDQDDFWLPDKLQLAIKKIEESKSNDKGTFYFSNVYIVDKNLENRHKSNIDRDVTNLKQVLMHNAAIGCTVVFDKALRDKVLTYNPNYIYMHDWWLYLICLSTGGAIIFDEDAYILYRQHGNNTLGYRATKRSLKEKLFFPTECEARKTSNELLAGYGNLMDEKSYSAVYTLANYTTRLKHKAKLITDNEYYKETGMARLQEKIAVMRNRK